MEQNFTDVMSKRTNEELIEIVTTKRDSYRLEAVTAAELELQTRRIDINQIQQIEQELKKEESRNQEIQSFKVNSWIRFVHYIIDILAFFVTALILSILLGLFLPTFNPNTMDLIGYGLLLIAFFLYFVFMESKYQKTLGKFLTKTKVTTVDGKKPELKEIFIRTACRLIPFDNVSYLFTRTGFHDYLSNTIVIQETKEKTNANMG